MFWQFKQLLEKTHVLHLKNNHASSEKLTCSFRQVLNSILQINNKLLKIHLRLQTNSSSYFENYAFKPMLRYWQIQKLFFFYVCREFLTYPHEASQKSRLDFSKIYMQFSEKSICSWGLVSINHPRSCVHVWSPLFSRVFTAKINNQNSV